MSINFEKEIIDTHSSISMDGSFPGQPLLVAFGGIAGELGIPPFEFFNLSKEFNVNRIYVRDLTQSWYQMGLPGLADNVEEVSLVLKEKISELNANKVVFIGNSMGGYAAILFGILLNADIVHAFSPQTFINRFHRFIYRDRRWRKYLTNVYKNSHKKYFDLRKVIHQDSRKLHCEINIYYSSNHRLDKIHAEHMKNIGIITLHSYAEGGHRLVKTLRDEGSLKSIINNSLNCE